MNQKELDRINELARKAKSVGLTEPEAEEQKFLRQKFIQAVRANLRGQLNQIDVIDKDGKIENLGEKYGKMKLPDA